MAAPINETEWSALARAEGESDWQRQIASRVARSILAPSLGGSSEAEVPGISLLASHEHEAALHELYSGESEWEGEQELNPVRKVYLDAMLEHMAHEAIHAESEQEAVEGLMPMLPALAGRLLPLAVRMAPKVAGKVMPQLARAVARTSPQLSRGVSRVVRTLYRDPSTRPMIQVVPRIAQNALMQIARQVVAGKPVTAQTASRILANQVVRVLGRREEVQKAVRRHQLLDGRYHRVTGFRLATTPSSGGSFRYCPNCGTSLTSGGAWAQPTRNVSPVPSKVVHRCGC